MTNEMKAEEAWEEAEEAEAERAAERAAEETWEEADSQGWKGLLRWLIGVPFLFYTNRKRKREIMDLIQQDKNYWKEECYKMKDLANSWHQMAKEIKTVLKHKAPEAHADFVESYGGEDKFQDWYKLPDIPIIENKEDDDLRSE